jgi:hypothetical protein
MGQEARGGAMSTEDDDKAPTPSQDEYIIRVDRRRRQKERLLNAPFIESDNFVSFERDGKHHGDRHVQYRISPFAEKVGSEVAALFGMSLSQYAKAVLYRDLGLIFEPIDRRRKRK